MIQRNASASEIKCVCSNARSIINTKTELNIMEDELREFCQSRKLTIANTWNSLIWICLNMNR